MNNFQLLHNFLNFNGEAVMRMGCMRKPVYQHSDHILPLALPLKGEVHPRRLA